MKVEKPKTKLMRVLVNEEVFRKLKVSCAEKGITIQSKINELLETL